MTAIVINLDALRTRIEEFLNDMQAQGHVTTYGPDSLTDWKFETFLQWLQKKQEMNTNGQETRPVNRISGLLRFPQR